ncbi:Methylated-DNA--protein-cysteine methyltransferase [Lachnellula subtilissima]|uniref:Methylated-DNA--protein-cysteine methyltransferase n=1 Tax=Lachnellula subtilissima TaxID=602034 RepID=A0A8H8UHM9_9HELO|nr:Methylated-DNA--protein-cysteine methyltransferase [Lachnellula subtilissima]
MVRKIWDADIFLNLYMQKGPTLTRVRVARLAAMPFLQPKANANISSPLTSHLSQQANQTTKPNQAMTKDNPQATTFMDAPIANEKRKRAAGDDATRPTKAIKMTELASLHDPEVETAETSPYFKATTAEPETHLTPYLRKISLSGKTPFQKRVLTALCQVPCGQYTTYGIMSKHLSSSPRAVGNALKNNPFAPQVPCHRVLASDGGLGGFMGSWGRGGEKGKNDDKKLKLLREEGVRFGGNGKVVGKVWDGFK